MHEKIKNIKEYIQDNEFRLTIFKDRIHLINYDEILSLEEDRISLMADDKRIIIKGKNMSLNKLLEKEALINGKTLNIEVNYNE